MNEVLSGTVLLCRLQLVFLFSDQNRNVYWALKKNKLLRRNNKSFSKKDYLGPSKIKDGLQWITWISIRKIHVCHILSILVTFSGIVT